MSINERPALRESLPHQTNHRLVVFYLAAILALLGFGAPTSGTIEIPLTFFLKDRLHLSASEVAVFRFWIALPVFFSFLIGFVADRWSPLGLGYRGHFIFFGLVTAALYAIAALGDVTSGALLFEFCIVTLAYLFVFAAWKGLLALIAQQHALTGQMSFLWGAVGNGIGLVSLLLGGALSDQLQRLDASAAAALLFMIGCALMILVALFGWWKPTGVFAALRAEPRAPSAFGDARRLLTHLPVYPTLLIWLLWNFAPGTGTVLQYYLSDTQHASDFQWGAFNAVFLASMTPTLVLFLVLARRFSLRSLLWLGAIVGVPQMAPLLLIDSADAALAVAVPMGLMGGISRGAFLALIIRACPPGLQATMMTLAGSVALLSSRVGNMWGSYLFDTFGGFTTAVVASMIVYALILPALLLVPRQLIATSDGVSTEERPHVDGETGAVQ